MEKHTYKHPIIEMRGSTMDTIFLSGEILVESIMKASLNNGAMLSYKEALKEC